MIILRQNNYSDYEKLYKEWKRTKDPKIAYKWGQAYNKAYDKRGNNLPEPDPEILESVDEYFKQQNPKEHKTYSEWKNAVDNYWSGKNYKLSPETAKYMRKATNGSEITEKIISKANK